MHHHLHHRRSSTIRRLNSRECTTVLKPLNTTLNREDRLRSIIIRATAIHLYRRRPSRVIVRVSDVGMSSSFIRVRRRLLNKRGTTFLSVNAKAKRTLSLL